MLVQTAKTNGERIVVIICMIIGAGAFAYVVGNICGLVAALDPEAAEYVNDVCALAVQVVACAFLA